MNALLQARVGRFIHRRKDEFSDWRGEGHDSIAQAKKDNGLNSRTFLKAAELPPNRNKRIADRRREVIAVAEDQRKATRRK